MDLLSNSVETLSRLLVFVEQHPLGVVLTVLLLVAVRDVGQTWRRAKGSSKEPPLSALAEFYDTDVAIYDQVPIHHEELRR